MYSVIINSVLYGLAGGLIVGFLYQIFLWFSY